VSIVQVAFHGDDASDLPKPMSAEEAAACADVSDRLDAAFILEPGSLDKVIGLNLRERNLLRRDLAVLKDFPNLQVLDLGMNYRITDAHLEHLEGLTTLRSLNLYRTRVTGGGLAHLLPLTKLQYLDLASTYVQDPGLLFVARLPELENLQLRSTAITDKGLAHLKRLTNLKTLSLFQCFKITDEGLLHLKGLSRLNNLDLSYCGEITDQGLAHLKALTSLESLNVRGTKVTQAGMDDLKKTLPKLRLER
jgi:hypothetical protein